MQSHEFRDLVAGMESSYLCSFLGITERTLKNWKSGKTKVPEMAVRLLRLKLEGDLSAICGGQWRRGGLSAQIIGQTHVSALLRVALTLG